eukprot:5093574-Pyramimonas_sp.AAC.1
MNSGVLQGCPLSGSLYVIASNPFLLDLEHCLVARGRLLGVVRACADDLGAVLFHNRAYPRLAR